MDEKRAREILGHYIHSDDSLRPTRANFLSWSDTLPNLITMDGRFSLEEIEAIAWWVRNMKIELRFE